MAKPHTNLKKLTNHQQTVLRDFENAVYDMAYIGATRPSEHEQIKEEYNRAKNLLIKHLAK